MSDEIPVGEFPTNRYIIVGLAIDGDPVATVYDGMDSIQGAVERLVLRGYRPVGGLAMCVDAKGITHMAQTMFLDIEPSPIVVPS